MNKVTIIGNLTRDPEIAETPTGVTVCKFAVAVNRKYKDDNGEVVTDFFNVVAWRGLAENCGKYLAKGKKGCGGRNIAKPLLHGQKRRYTVRNGDYRGRSGVLNAESGRTAESRAES